MNDDRNDQNETGNFDRRDFLKVLGAAFSTAILPDMLAGCAVDADLVPPSVADVEALTPRQTIGVVRPEDHLVLTIGFVNLKRSPTGQLVKVTATLPAFLIVDFPSQALVEDAATGASIPATFSANAWLGGSSRLIFQLPTAYTSAPYSLSAVLGLCATSSVVVADAMKNKIASTVTPGATPALLPPLFDGLVAARTADTDPAASARQMVADRTMDAIQPYQLPYKGSSGKPTGFSDGSVSVIEAPYRLQLSPNAMAGWSHATSPVQGKSGAFEIWHTVLGARTVAPTVAGPVDERNAYLRTARALWTRDADLCATQPPAVCAGADVAWNPGPALPRNLQGPAVSPRQRGKIVELSSTAADARPIQINRLMLSSLGGYLDAHGEWTDPAHEVDSWVHRMAGGRETYAQVVSTGVILPFGNTVTKIHVTTRNDDPLRGPIGSLFAFDVYTIQNPITSYRSGDFAKQTTRDTLLRWPFAMVELTQTQFIGQAGSASGNDYWPVDMSGSPMMIPAIGYDQRGRAIHFSVPFYFVEPFPHDVPTAIGNFRTKLASPPIAPPRTTAAASLKAPSPYDTSLNVAMNGQRIAYAYSKRDDTTFATRELYVDVTPSGEGAFGYVPIVTGAKMDVEAVQSYTDGQPVTVRYHDRYASNGAGLDPAKNASQLLFKLDQQVLVDFRNRPDGGTAFVAPNMRFNALSRTTGPTYDGGASALLHGRGLLLKTSSAADKDGGFDPKAYLNLAADELDKIRIFGVFSLIDIIKAVDPNEAATDMRGLADEVEQAALRYAPKFVTEALNEVEKILSTIAEVKGGIESIWTHIKEFLGTEYVEAIAASVAAGNPHPTVNASVGGMLANAAGIAGDQWAMVVQKFTVTMIDAYALYAALAAALDHLESFDFDALPDALRLIVAKGVALKNAIVSLATFAARADLDATSAVTAAASQAGAQAAYKVKNALLKLAPGLTDGFLKKFTVLQEIIGDVEKVGEFVDRLKKLFEEAKQALNSLSDLTMKLDWQPKIGSYFLPGTDWLVFRPATQHALSLALEARAKAKEDKPAGVDVTCRLDHFDMCLGPLDAEQNPAIALQFDHISFVALAGKKPDVDVKINGIQFGGPLSFLESLRKIIPLDGFSDPPHLEVDKQGIHAGFSIHVPNIAIGAFSMENICLSAELEIPFFGDGSAASMLTFRFSFCDKDHPFLITVAMLGGGGYFVMTLSPRGIETLEASICVGAQVAINLLDIAQGSVSIMVGITFTVKNVEGGKDVSLTAFLRLHGELDVLGIVSVSVDVNLSMTYDLRTKVLVAEGTIKINVDLLLFSIHVELQFRKEFHSCNNDPTLRQLMPPDGNNLSQFWTDYCNAYAA